MGTAVLAIFAASFLVGFSGAASPGPLLAFNIRETVRRGFLAGPAVVLGHGLLELAVVVLLALGLTRLFSSDAAVGTIGLLGGLFLLWMAVGTVRHDRSTEAMQQAGSPSSSDMPSSLPGQPKAQPQPGKAILISASALRPAMLGGVLVSLSNPYWAVWWLSIGAALMTRSLELGPLGIAAFYVGHVLSDLSWYSMVSAAVATGRRWLTARVYRGIMLGCGAFLAAMGVYFLASSGRLLLGVE